MNNADIKHLFKSLTITLLLSWFTQASAEINDYFIKRLILYKSDCKLDTLSRKPFEITGLEFFATCKNVSFYPDGLLIHCLDEDDETTCNIKTKSRSFDQLELLRQ